MASIADPSRCTTSCSVAGFRGGSHSEGDVRMCIHGRVWLCVGNSNGRMWTTDGFWRRLSPVWDFFTHRKALRALDV